MITIQKKRKYKPKNRKGVKKNKIDPDDLRQWILFTIIYVLLIGYLYGMSAMYFPDPLYIGSIGVFNQYFHPGPTIIYGGIAVYSIITVLIFKRII